MCLSLKSLYIYTVIFYFYLKLTFCANILYLSPLASHSHHIWNRILALGLVDRGHNVTFMSPYQDSTVVINYTYIQIEGLCERLEKEYNFDEYRNSDVFSILIKIHAWARSNCKHVLKTQALNKLINYPENFKFDIILYDISIGYCLYPLIAKFNYPPTVGITTFLLPGFISYRFGNSFFSSYIPWYCLPYSDEMTFYQRLWNYIFTRLDPYLRLTRIHEADENDARKVFGDDIPRWYEVEKYIKIVLANTDPILDNPQPLPPNIIPVGGLHTTKPKQIPGEFQKILDNANNGVILFSLGTLIRANKLQGDQKRVFLDAFRRLNQTVIWKFEGDLDGVPKNVLIRKWIPQNDLLSHPNVKLFIGHGGSLSTQEAIYHGVPMVLIPFIADQYLNGNRIVQKQFGFVINSTLITADNIYNCIREILDNPIYRENVRKTSARFRDQPQPPLDRAIFWIEYMIKHGNADDFLSPKARHMLYYQAADIDVITFLVLSLLIILLISFKIIYSLAKLIATPNVKLKVHRI